MTYNFQKRRVALVAQQNNITKALVECEQRKAALLTSQAEVNDAKQCASSTMLASDFQALSTQLLNALVILDEILKALAAEPLPVPCATPPSIAPRVRLAKPEQINELVSIVELTAEPATTTTTTTTTATATAAS